MQSSSETERKSASMAIEQYPITTLTKTHCFEEQNAFHSTLLAQPIAVYFILMDKLRQNAQARPVRVGCGSNPNNAGEIISMNGNHNYGGDVRELVALVGTGASGRGSSNQTAHGLAQANSVAANKRW